MVGVLVPIVVALTQLAKTWVPTRVAPALSLCMGIALSLVFNDASLQSELFEGFIIGLTASGLYSGVKATIKG